MHAPPSSSHRLVLWRLTPCLDRLIAVWIVVVDLLIVGCPGSVLVAALVS